MLFSNIFLFNIVRAAVLAAVAVGLLGLTLRNFRRLSPTGHRRVWFGILLLGLCVFRIPIDVPFYKPESVVLAPQTEAPLMIPVREELPLPEMRPLESSAIPIATPAEAASPEPTWRIPETATLLLFAWAGGLGVLLLRRVYLALRLHRLLRRTEKADAADVRPWAELLNRYGIAENRIPILWTDEAGPALVRSWFGDRLLYPRSLWDELSERQRLGVLRHELCHYLHGDAWAEEIARLLAMLQWFNPAAWLALHKFAEATEWRCDDFSYNGREGRPEDLIETLLSVHDSTESLGLYLSSFARLNVLHRINRLLETPQPQESTLMKKMLLFVLPPALFALGLLQINLVAQQSEPATPEPAITEPEASARDQAQPLADASGSVVAGSERLGLFSTEEKGKTVWKIRGRVLYPDGQPAKKINVSYNYDDAKYLNKTDEEGYFTESRGIERPKGQLGEDFIMAGVSPSLSSSEKIWLWEVPPTILKNVRDQPPEKFIFRLQKACPVSVEVQFEGEAAQGYVDFESPLDLGENFQKKIQLSVVKDKTGFYRCALLPREHEICWSQTPWENSKTVLTISEKDVAESTPQKLVLLIPAPSVIDLGEENDKQASLALVLAQSADHGGRFLYTDTNDVDSEGRFLVQLSPYCNFLICDDGEKAGVLCIKDAETAGKTYRLIMREKATGKVRLISKATGKPIANALLQYDFPFDYAGKMQYTGRGVDAKTDGNGVLELQGMIPEAEYRITFRDPVKVSPNEGPQVPEIKRSFIATNPDELNDFGEVMVDVPSEAQPLAHASGSEMSGSTNDAKKLVVVRGRVTDPDGKPVKGALLVWETTWEQQRENRAKAARTDKDGRYSSPPLPAMQGSITVIAEGYAPDMKPVDFATEKEVDFSLEKGKTLQIRVVDQNGEPIPNVDVSISDPPFQIWRVGANIFSGRARYSFEPRSGIPFQTDKNGLYRWTWAPADAIGFSFDKTGYESIYSDPREPDLMFTAREEPYIVVMRKAFTISGTVVDDATGKPIPKFRFSSGSIVGSHPFFGRVAWQKDRRDSSVMKNGKFEHVFTFLDDRGYVFSIEVDGYEAFVSRDIEPDEANPTFAVRLKKSDGVSGTVVLPDGSPAAGAIVYLAEPGAYLGVRDPMKNDYMQTTHAVTKTDNSGRFTIFNNQEEAYAVYIEHPKGLAWVNRDDFLKDRRIQLRGFAKLELILPKEFYTDPEDEFELQSDLATSPPGGPNLGGVSYTRKLLEGQTRYTFDSIVAGNYTFVLKRMKARENRRADGLNHFDAVKMSFDVAAGETKTLDWSDLLKTPGM